MADDEHENEQVSRAEFQQVLDGLRSLQDGFAELREARTPDERREAREDIADAREDLDGLAKRLGISRATLEKATSEAKRSEERERLAPIVREIISELIPEPEPEPEKEKDPKPKREPKAKKKPEDEPPPAEDGSPSPGHWSERFVPLW